MSIKPSLDICMSKLLDRRFKNSRLRKLEVKSSDLVDFSSNDFLGLAKDTEFKEKFFDSLNSIESIGSTGSRLLDGNSQLAEDLESKIAHFHHSKAALLVNSGYEANLSIFTCIPQPGDVIIYDELIHASVHDGMARSRASEKIAFKHNCVLDLETKIMDALQLYPTAYIFVAVEGVYSMEGDIAPLKNIVDLLKIKFPKRNNGYLIVDEAHSMGVYGPRGAGLVSHLGLADDVFLLLVTFGKTLGCTGAAILCNEITRKYLLNYARPIIYSTFMSTPNMYAIATAYNLLMSKKYETQRITLQNLIQFCHEKLQDLDVNVLKRTSVPNSVLSIDSRFTQTPVFALYTSFPRQLAATCQKNGFLVRPIVAPTVPAGAERVRLCLHAFNSENDIQNFVKTVTEWVLNFHRSQYKL